MPQCGGVGHGVAWNGGPFALRDIEERWIRKRQEAVTARRWRADGAAFGRGAVGVGNRPGIAGPAPAWGGSSPAGRFDGPETVAARRLPAKSPEVAIAVRRRDLAPGTGPRRGCTGPDGRPESKPEPSRRRAFSGRFGAQRPGVADVYIRNPHVYAGPGDVHMGEHAPNTSHGFKGLGPPLPSIPMYTLGPATARSRLTRN